MTMKRPRLFLIGTLVLSGYLCQGTSRAQEGGPFLPGEYSIGFQEFVSQDAARNDRSVRTLVWYPAQAGLTEGNPIRYVRPLAFGWTQESPHIGGIMDAPAADTGPFPLVVLSHGNGDVAQEFELLGEFLASHAPRLLFISRRDGPRDLGVVIGGFDISR